MSVTKAATDVRHTEWAGERYRQQLQSVVADFPRVPTPIYRHASPSAPWPWMSFSVDASEIPSTSPGLQDNSAWNRYPQNIFRNWTRDQVDRSRLLAACNDLESSTVYKLNLLRDGCFDEQAEVRKVRKNISSDLQTYWDHLGMSAPLNIRVQALFIEDMTSPVLQMLGTRYNVEPFFFASSANWIPSRYQEDYKALEDHITVVLPFLRILKNPRPVPVSRTRPFRMPTFIPTGEHSPRAVGPLPYTNKYEQTFDTQGPLPLPGNKLLIQDLLSIHVVRNTTTNTIISYHPNSSFQGTSAERLQVLVRRIGDSVYWSEIFEKSQDPTFLLLAMFWYPLYSWDEAFEDLLRYINALEYDVLRLENVSLGLVRELHALQANLLHYQQLLEHFQLSIEFIRDTPNPAMNDQSISNKNREESADMLQIEANNLISEIVRLTRHGEMMSCRLDNVIQLAVATININETKNSKGLAEVTMQDSATMKQLAYLTMVFLPAIYLANVFSMNIREMNPGKPPIIAPTTLLNYIETTIPLTLVTSWLAISFQKESSFFPTGSGILHRALWPLFYVYAAIFTEAKKRLRSK